MDVLGGEVVEVDAVNLRRHLQVTGHPWHGGDVVHRPACQIFDFCQPLFHFKEPGPPRYSQGLQGGTHRQADGAVRAALVRHHQVGGEGVKAAVHALHGSVIAFEIKPISALSE